MKLFEPTWRAKDGIDPSDVVDEIEQKMPTHIHAKTYQSGCQYAFKCETDRIEVGNLRCVSTDCRMVGE